MKDKILYLIIGILIGAIIATICFYFYNKNNVSNMPNMNGNRPQMMQGGPHDRTSNQDFDGETPPEIPTGERPEKTDTFSNDSAESNNSVQTNLNIESTEKTNDI